MRIRCPSCGKQEEIREEALAEYRFRPFCSRRCKMIDLGNWLDEVYRFSRPISAEDLDEEHPSTAARPGHPSTARSA